MQKMTQAKAMSESRRFVGKCGACGKPASVETFCVMIDGFPRLEGYSISHWQVSGSRVIAGLRCTCGDVINMSEVQAKTTKHKCGAKCTHSTGPACECECGGEFHGSGHRMVA
jgi:hypothetical protein